MSKKSEHFEKLMRNPKMFRPQMARLPLPPATRSRSSQFVFLAMPGYDIWDPGSSPATNLALPGAEPVIALLDYSVTKADIKVAYDRFDRLNRFRYDAALVLPMYARRGLPPRGRKVAPHRLGSVWGPGQLYDVLAAALPPGELEPTEHQPNPFRWEWAPQWLRDVTRECSDARGNVLPRPWLRALELAVSGMDAGDAVGEAMLEWAPPVLSTFVQFADKDALSREGEQLRRAWERQRTAQAPTDWYLTARDCLTFADNFGIIKPIGAGRIKWGRAYKHLYRIYLQNAGGFTNIAESWKAQSDKPSDKLWPTFEFQRKPKPTATDLLSSDPLSPPTPPSMA